MAIKPFEIIAAPFTVWLSPVGTAFPDVDEAPAVAWVLLGTSGNKNYHEDGVTISHAQTIELFRVLGATPPVQASRTEEDLMISLTLWDMSLEHYRVALNHNALTDVAAAAGTPGYRHIALMRGLDLSDKALLVRGPSPYANSFNMQYEVPRVIHTGEPEVVHSKGEPAGLAMEFTALYDADQANPLGRLVGQDAAAI